MKKRILFVAMCVCYITLNMLSCGSNSNKPKLDAAQELWEDTERWICHVDTMFSEEYDSIMVYGTDYSKDSIKNRIADLKAAIAEDAANNAKQLYNDGKISESDMERFVKRWVTLQSNVSTYEN